ncbi:hypothetical protein KR093_005535 [Drosophila rubida]|uniref:Gustatory receptor n=1 Tax=Drosophila rubida TaxID=30044 RepID=A0AAD4JTF1_9MUSC|nr:hypothetical protein KR093_005535 [Drosophila rubida]
MFGSRFKLHASGAAWSLLRCACNFATALGVITFRVACNRHDGRLVAQRRSCFKWFSMLLRMLISYLYCHFYASFVIVLPNTHFRLIVGVRMLCSLICALVILALQVRHEEQAIALLNSFLRLFRRVQALPGCQDMCFGGRRELILLLLVVLCQVYQCCYLLPTLIEDFDILFTFTIALETYCSLSAALISNICFVGYLSVGVLYGQMNCYVRTQLRQQLEQLTTAASRRERRAASQRLDECLAIYEEIRRVCSDFQRLFDLPLCLVLVFGFLTMALVSFFIVLNQFNGISTWVLEAKLLLELLLLTLSIQGAINSSRVVRRLSLENYYCTDSKEWHQQLEMFLTRLNYGELRVRPLGLFDVSNELILLFLSALVTYLTYIIQYGMQSIQL